MKFARYNPVKQIVNDTVYQQGMQDYCKPIEPSAGQGLTSHSGMPGGCYEQEQAC